MFTIFLKVSENQKKSRMKTVNTNFEGPRDSTSMGKKLILKMTIAALSLLIIFHLLSFSPMQFRFYFGRKSMGFFFFFEIYQKLFLISRDIIPSRSQTTVSGMPSCICKSRHHTGLNQIGDAWMLLFSPCAEGSKWLRRSDKTSRGVLISRMPLFYGTDPFLGLKVQISSICKVS